MGWRITTVIASVVIVESGAPSTGVFVYNGIPSSSNPPIASAAAGTTDPFGNTVVPGVCAYITLAAGLGAGRYAIDLGDQANPYTNVASLTFKNLTHAPNLPPAASAATDTTHGNSISLDTGRLNSGDNDAFINLNDSHFSGTTGIQLHGDTVIVQPVVSATGILQLLGALELVDQANPASVAGGLKLWADATGFPLFVPDSNSGDTTVYQVGHRLLFTTSNFPGNSTSPLAITGLSLTLGPGSYYVSGMINIAQGTVTSGQRIAFSGTSTVTSMRISGRYADTTALVTGNPIEITALAGTPQAQNMTANDVYDFWFEGVVNVATAGTFGPTIQNLTSGDTCTIGQNSLMVVHPAN